VTDDRPMTHLTYGKISNGHISVGGHPIQLMFGSTVGFFGVGRSNGAISGMAEFNRYVGENNARGVIRLVTI